MVRDSHFFSGCPLFGWKAREDRDNQIFNLGCVWFSGYEKVVGGSHNHLVGGNHFLCLVVWGG